MSLPVFKLRLMMLLSAALGAALCGCSSAPELMPTPNLYVLGDVDPFLEVAPELRSNKVDVLYMTDRVAENDSKDKREYGYRRSRSLGFGITQVQFGENVSWEELVKASRSKERSVTLELSLPRTTELGRFSDTPRNLIEAPGSAESKTTDASEQAAQTEFKKTLSGMLQRTRVKEVFIFVHGYNNTFKDGVSTIAELWHFMGREGVPMAYTWPAGSPGALSYMYDRESSEFTVFHLKQMLRLIASCPEVNKVHLIGHSRGTDVVASAIRELHLEIRGTGKSTRAELKLGTVVLAAPDLDLDVVIQRMATAQVGRVPERFALYICSNDKALGISNWLFGGLTRLGGIKSTMFKPAELAALRKYQTPQIIDARVSDSGAFGHDYFHSNPAVSSDLILLMRYQLPPGADFGRPLRIDKKGFWVIDDDYPGPQRVPVVDSEEK